MSTDNILAIPKLPLWATDPGAAEEPPIGAKVAGYQLDSRPPAKWQNWLQLQTYGWLRGLLGGTIADWRRGTFDHGAGTGVDFLVYHPSPGNGEPGFLGGSSALIRTSVDGRSWSSASTALAVSVARGAAAIDTGNVLVADSAGLVHYANSVEHTDWAAPSNTDSGMGGSIFTIATKFRDSSDFLIVGGGAGAIRIKSDGASGGGLWASPSVGPVTVEQIRTLLYLGGTTWLALDDDGECFQSTDDGDNWASLSTIPSSSFTTYAARCPQTGAIVWLENQSGGALHVWYSSDDGATWTEGTLQAGTEPTSGDWRVIKAVGGGAFILCAELNVGSLSQIWFSADGGRSSRRVHMADSAAVQLLAMDTDGQKLAAMGEDAVPASPTYHTACLDSTGLPDIP